MPIVSIYKWLVGKEQAEANALLCAAAPELLGALENLMEVTTTERVERSPRVLAAWKQAGDAIIKARGESR